MITFLIFAGSILLLIGFHEAGHFFAAKAFGVYVIEFAIGFGPRLVTVRGKETRYSLRAIPFGGYVRMAGEDRRETDDAIPADRLLYRKSPLVRAAISFAGPAANLLLAFVVTLAVVWSFSFPVLQIADVVPDTPAADVFMPGDRIMAIDGRNVYLIDQAIDAIQRSEGDDMEVVIRREGEEETVRLRAELADEESHYVIGAYFQSIAYTNELASVALDSPIAAVGLRDGDLLTKVGEADVGSAVALLVELESEAESTTLTVRRDGEIVSVPIGDPAALAEAFVSLLPFSDLGVDFRRTGFVGGLAIGSGQFAEYTGMLGSIVGGIVSGRVAASEALHGPVGVARTLGEGFRLGPAVFFQLLAFLSLNFGLLNLIPFPGLDGSRVGFAFYEMIRGRPIPVEREGLIHAIGFIVLIGVMILITYKDLVTLFR
ncbi:MAG: RIP metalloprotease RseP [Candidatus Bipolaricaulia bacterium]